MQKFLFGLDRRVEEIATGRFGRVKYQGTTGDGTSTVRFYDVLFEDSKDGKPERREESKLRAAGPEAPGQG